MSACRQSRSRRRMWRKCSRVGSFSAAPWRMPSVLTTAHGRTTGISVGSAPAKIRLDGSVRCCSSCRPVARSPRRLPRPLPRALRPHRVHRAVSHATLGYQGTGGPAHPQPSRIPRSRRAARPDRDSTDSSGATAGRHEIPRNPRTQGPGSHPRRQRFDLTPSQHRNHRRPNHPPPSPWPGRDLLVLEAQPARPRAPAGHPDDPRRQRRMAEPAQLS